MATIFTKIINREIPGHIVAENDQFLAFLDISPLVEGHTLVVPKKEMDYIFDLDEETLSGLHLFSKRVAAALKSTISCERVGMTVIGLEVPHAHVHLIPINSMADMNFDNMKLSPSNEELSATGKKIAEAFK